MDERVEKGDTSSRSTTSSAKGYEINEATSSEGEEQRRKVTMRNGQRRAKAREPSAREARESNLRKFRLTRGRARGGLEGKSQQREAKEQVSKS